MSQSTIENNRRFDNIMDVFKGFAESMVAVSKIKPTHLFEMMHEFSKVSHMDVLHYMADGMRGETVWTDGQKYEIIIRPIKEGAKE